MTAPRRHRKPVTVRGVTYDSRAAAARALGVTTSAVRAAVAAGVLDQLGLGRGEVAVTVRGVCYPSLAAAARALGVTEAAVRSARRRGTLDRIGCGMGRRQAMRVRIGGVDYDDAPAAARALGLRRETVYAALAAGDPDRLVRPRRYDTARKRPVTIGPVTFPSHREAARQLGFANLDYVWTALHRRSKRGRERILAAVMRHVAARESRAALPDPSDAPRAVDPRAVARAARRALVAEAMAAGALRSRDDRAALALRLGVSVDTIYTDMRAVSRPSDTAQEVRHAA